MFLACFIACWLFNINFFYLQCCSVLFRAVLAVARLTSLIYGKYSFGFVSCCCPVVDVWGGCMALNHSDLAHCLCPPGWHMCTDSSHVLLSGRCRVSQHAAASENTREPEMGGAWTPRVTSATTGARCHRNMNNISLAISNKSYVVARDVS